MVKESTPKIIDPERFEVEFGSSHQAAIFETIAQHIRNTGDVAETIVLSTGSERYQALVTFYTEDLSRLPLASFKP